VGVWVVNAEVLASSRFSLSPLLETLAVLGQLATGTPHPAHAAQHRAVATAFQARVRADPFARALLGHVLGNGWMPDFMGRPPRPSEMTFQEEIGRLRATDPDVATADLRRACGAGALPADARVSDPADAVADLLTWVWQHAVEADWPRRSRLLQADVIGRTSTLTRDGLAAALNDLNPRIRWLGDGRLEINSTQRPARHLDGATLCFTPTSTSTGWVAWDLPSSYAIVYPARGLLRHTPDNGYRDAVAALLGSRRADLLRHLDAPISTSQLHAHTGGAISGLSEHLRVLLDAGLVDRRRTGRHVLYYRSALGDQLLDAARTTDTARAPAPPGEPCRGNSATNPTGCARRVSRDSRAGARP
jgi:DNA-binding transcriptional ArsR family regulator